MEVSGQLQAPKKASYPLTRKLGASQSRSARFGRTETFLASARFQKYRLALGLVHKPTEPPRLHVKVTISFHRMQDSYFLALNLALLSDFIPFFPFVGVYLSIYLSSIYIYTYLSIYHLYIHIYIHTYIHIHPSIYLSIYLSIHISIPIYISTLMYLSIYLLIYLSMYTCIFPFFLLSLHFPPSMSILFLQYFYLFFLQLPIHLSAFFPSSSVSLLTFSTTSPLFPFPQPSI